MERPWVARRTASSGEVVANLKGLAKSPGLPGEETAAMGQKKEASSPRACRQLSQKRAETSWIAARKVLASLS
jgi:hypothetical protein